MSVHSTDAFVTLRQCNLLAAAGLGLNADWSNSEFGESSIRLLDPHVRIVCSILIFSSGRSELRWSVVVEQAGCLGDTQYRSMQTGHVFMAGSAVHLAQGRASESLKRCVSRSSNSVDSARVEPCNVLAMVVPPLSAGPSRSRLDCMQSAWTWTVVVWLRREHKQRRAAQMAAGLSMVGAAPMSSSFLLPLAALAFSSAAFFLLSSSSLSACCCAASAPLFIHCE